MEPDLRVGEGVGVVLVDAGAVVDGVELVELDGVAAADVAAVVCVAGAAEALAMPAAAPAVASAPATIVAPSILEMVIGSDLLEVEWWMVQAIVRDRAKHHRRWA